MRVVTAVLTAAAVLALAGCGDDEGTTTEAALSPDTSTEPRGSAKQGIERTAAEWAALFAAAQDVAACEYQTQPLCERIACERVNGLQIRNCRPPSSAFRRSFEDATVQGVAIRGNRALATFSNGEEVEIVHPKAGAARICATSSTAPGCGRGGPWLVHKIGPKAGALSD